MTQWREPPAQWISGRWLKTTRQVSRGLLTSFSWTLTIEAQNGQSVVRHDFAVQPRSTFAAIMLVLFGCHQLDRRINEAGQSLALWAKGSIDHPTPRPRVLPRQAQATLSDRAMLADGSEYGRGQVSRLVRWMAQAQRVDTAFIRPNTLAALWNADPDEVTEVLLAASTAGILSKRWRVNCQSCAHTAVITSNLSEIPESMTCRRCTAKLSNSLAREVEIVFVPNEEIGGFKLERYAFDSPSAHPAVGARLRVQAKSRWSTKWPSIKAPLQAKVTDTGSTATLAANSRSVSFSVAHGTISVSANSETKGTVELVNHDDVDRCIVLESSAAIEHGYSARRALLLQAHQDIGGKELPGAGQSFFLDNVAVLTTDLAGLAARYQRGGDAETFKAVSDLLRETTEIARDYGGSVASRLGEVVIAVFPDSQKAFSAAMRLSAHGKAEGLPPFRGSIDVGNLAAVAHKGRLVMKGPCIESAVAVLNNLAPGEIGLGNETVGAPGMIKLIQGYQLIPMSDQGVDAQKLILQIQAKTVGGDHSASAA